MVHIGYNRLAIKWLKSYQKYLLFIKVNPEANVCPNFNLTLMVDFTLIPLFNY